MTTVATPSADVAWTGRLTGVWTVGTSQVGGTDVVGSGFGNNVFDSLPMSSIEGDQWVKKINFSRGAKQDRGRVEMGECTLTLHDPDGHYNPKNPTSPLAGYLVPLRPLRVRSTHPSVNGGLPKGRFNGFIKSIRHNPDPKVQETVIVANDLFLLLRRCKPVIASTGVTTVGAVLGLLLDSIGFTSPAMRALDDGNEIPDFVADGTVTGDVHARNLLTVDLGRLFVDGDGIVTYHERSRRYANAAVADTFTGSEISGAKPGVDIDLLRNRAKVTRAGGAEQSAVDAASAGLYGFADVDDSPITSSYLTTDAQAANLASFLVAINKDPRGPTPEVVLWNKSDANVIRQMTGELEDRVAVSENRGGTSISGSLAGIQTEIVNRIERTQYLVTERVLNMWTVGISQVGGTDVVGY